MLSPATIMFCFRSGGIFYGVAGAILFAAAAQTIRIALRTIHGDTR